MPSQKNNDTASIALYLNKLLRNNLTGINQYFLHARMLKHMGFLRLADAEYKQSLDTMKYTDQLVNHILHMGAIPEMQELGRLRIGHSAYEMMKNDLELVKDKQDDLQEAVVFTKTCGGGEGCLSALNAMLASEEGHRAFLEAELKSIDTIGLNAYLQSQA